MSTNHFDDGEPAQRNDSQVCLWRVRGPKWHRDTPLVPLRIWRSLTLLLRLAWWHWICPLHKEHFHEFEQLCRGLGRAHCDIPCVPLASPEESVPKHVPRHWRQTPWHRLCQRFDRSYRPISRQDCAGHHAILWACLVRARVKVEKRRGGFIPDDVTNE